MANNNKAIHTNLNYEVVVHENQEGQSEYAVVNRKTGVKEYTASSLANAIGEAEQANTYLEFHMWDWIRAQGRRNREEIDKELVAEQFPVEEVPGPLN